MLIFMRYFLLLISLTICFGALAQEKVYKKVNPDGSVEYSDQPIQGSEVMNVPKGSTFTMPETPAVTPASTNPAEETSVKYDSLVITQPENDKAIRSNNGTLTALASVTPALAPDNRFRWKMDGNIVQDVNAPELRLNNVDRGSHTLQAEIVDANGKVIITSDSVTFHMMRVHAP
ncbi:MAG: hypothetical protein R3354_02645 [Thiohalomonadales bacterium]|nr:hypothetical protein [Thiohalomonadales bacterium]